jgi:hypothetical protein
MKPVKIIIAAVAIVLIPGVLNGCSLITSGTKTPVASDSLLTPRQTIEKAQKVTKDISMKLSAERDGDIVTVKITLDNPDGRPVTSAESWLSYDPAALKGQKINVSDSAFSLAAPYDNTFDEVNGLVMIGRANNVPITAKTIVVGEAVFKLQKEGTTMMDIYDYQDNMSGHASVNMMLEGAPYNILLKPESPALAIEN